MQRLRCAGAAVALSAAVAGVVTTASSATGADPTPPVPKIDFTSALVPVDMGGGRVGYITRADFNGPDYTRQQVLGWPRDANGNFVEPSRTVPIYAEDGTTVIGSWRIG